MSIEGGVSMLNKVSTVTISPTVGGLSSLGAELTAPMSLPSLDTHIPSLGKSFLENTSTYSIRSVNFSLGGERIDPGIDLNPINNEAQLTVGGVLSEAEAILFPNKLNEGSAVVEAEHWLKNSVPEADVKTPVPDVFQAAFAEPEESEQPVIETPIPEVFIKAFEEPAPKIEKQIETQDYRSRVAEQAALVLVAAHTVLPLSSQIALMPEINEAIKDRVAIVTSIKPDLGGVHAQPLFHAENTATTTIPRSIEVPEVEEEIEEEAIEVEQVVVGKKEKLEEKAFNDESSESINFVEDKEVSRLRKEAIKDAIKKGGRVGKLVIKHLSQNFWRTKSPIVGQEGHDFTIDLTAKDLSLEEREYKTDEEAEGKLVAIVDKHAPVKVGEEGKKVTQKEIRKVLMGEEHGTLIEPETIAQIVVKRVLKKVAQVKTTGQVVKLLQEEEQKKTESNLADLGLEQVYANSR